MNRLPVGVFAYPWDLIGDPAAADRLAELGATSVTLAAAYHSTTALTPRHPVHRVVHAPHSAVYYPPDPGRWRRQALRPSPQTWCRSPDAFGEAARALTAAGLPVHAWVVLAHNSSLGSARPEYTVRNAYGDHYAWALCVAQPMVRRYAATLAAEAASRPAVVGVELESCGWYGYAHLHAHDKTGGVAFGAAAQYLLSLCFCPHCRNGYRRHGADPDGLREAVATALGPLWPGGAGNAGGDGWSDVCALLGPETAELTLAWRAEAARRFQSEVCGAVRAAAPHARILLHAEPEPWRTGANAGVDAAAVAPVTDGLVVPAAAVGAAKGAVAKGAGLVAANLAVVSGMGGRPDLLAEASRRAAADGAGELRLYHPGIASDRDLAAVRAALRSLPAAQPGAADGGPGGTPMHLLPGSRTPSPRSAEAPGSLGQPLRPARSRVVPPCET